MGLQRDTEMSSCIFSGSKVSVDGWDAGETRLQGGEMQGSSGSTRISLLIVFEVRSFRISFLFDVVTSATA